MSQEEKVQRTLFEEEPSSTSRKLPRAAFDYYPTPEWCTALLLHHYKPTHSFIVEPGAGDGAICRVIRQHNRCHHIKAIEIQPQFEEELRKVCDSVIISDLFDVAFDPGLSFVGNPPFCLALEFLEHIFQYDPLYVAFLLRLDFLGSQTRASFHNTHPLTQLIVLGKRPGFTVDGKTDLYNYAWFVWHKNAKPKSPIVAMPEDLK